MQPLMQCQTLHKPNNLFNQLNPDFEDPPRQGGGFMTLTKVPDVFRGTRSPGEHDDGRPCVFDQGGVSGK
jgi:hypothetical protein